MLAHGRSVGFGFVNYDDHLFIQGSPQTLKGLTWEGARWALTDISHDGNWVPLARLSHMLDIQLFGLDARWHHLTNVLLHTANVLLLWTLLVSLTGWRWRAFTAAMLLAVHPIHVESVAWIAERRDVLSLFFGLLTMLAYTRYARSGNPAIYILTCIGVGLSILSKPSMVTLPAVLCLLDYWPLTRWRTATTIRHRAMMVLEKVPLFGIVSISVFLTLLAQQSAMAEATWLPLSQRLVRVPLSYMNYLQMLVWPVNIPAIHPLHFDWTLIQAVVSLACLLGLTAATVLLRRAKPYLLMGWLWFLGTMLPMIGLIQVGQQTHASRYAYYTFIGLYIALAWLFGDAWLRFNLRLVRWGAAAASVMLTIAMIAGSYHQAWIWSSNESLYQGMRVTDHANPMAATQAFILIQQGKLEEARRLARARAANHLLQAGDALDAWTLVEIQQDNISQAASLIRFMQRAGITTPFTDHNIGLVARARGEHPLAINALERVVRQWPAEADYRLKLASAYAGAGQWPQMMENLQLAIQIGQHQPHTLYQAGMLCFRHEHFQEAAKLLQEVMSLPDFSSRATGWYALGLSLAKTGQLVEAAAAYENALKINPQWSECWNSLGVVQARLGDLSLACASFTQAVKFDPADLQAASNLSRAQSQLQSTYPTTGHSPKSSAPPDSTD